jgi:hypothetical protein
MEMNMMNSLPGIRAGIYHQAVAALVNLFLFSQFARYHEQATEEVSIIFADLINGADVGVGDDQQVDGRSRVLVDEGGDRFILINYFSRRLPGDNLAKNTVSRHFPNFFYYT